MSVSSYDQIAEWYDDWVGPDSMDNDPSFRAVELLAGDVTGLRICDLCCGQGRTTRRLADLGAHVTGIDLSTNMLEIARRHERTHPRGIEYLNADARTLESIADATFDGVVCFLALMDVADLAPTARSVSRILRPGGWFVFAITHPCYKTPRSGELPAAEGWIRTVGSYFAEGYWRSDELPGPPGKVGAYHRTLSTYLNTMLDTGFILERISEPPLTGAAAERRPVWTEVPVTLIARFRSHHHGV